LVAVDKIRTVLLARTLPVAKAKQEVSMAKIDLDSLNIEELALLCDPTIEKAGGKGRGTARGTRSRNGEAFPVQRCAS
jgi:hypothetical protein